MQDDSWPFICRLKQCDTTASKLKRGALVPDRLDFNQQEKTWIGYCF